MDDMSKIENSFKQWHKNGQPSIDYTRHEHCYSRMVCVWILKWIVDTDILMHYQFPTVNSFYIL